jgi:NitT/TauT family transport system permease protein
MVFTCGAVAENDNAELMNTARVFGASGGMLYRYVILPAALPFVIAGLRLGIGRAWKGMVVAELYVVVGIGALLDAYQRSLAVSELFVLLVTLMILGASSVKVLYWLQNRFAPWGSAPTF